MDNSKSIFKNVDWPMLLFLLGLTYVKLYIKLIAVVLYVVYVIVKKYPLVRINRVQVFYLTIISIAIFTGLLNGSLGNKDYQFGFLLGTIQWGIALLASYLILISTKLKTQTEVLRLVKLFFLINAVVSIGSLLYIVVDSGFQFPYWSSSLKYGVSTGDYIRGVFSDSSIANAAICALGSIYFIRHNLLRWALLCSFIMMLCTSNITLLLFLLVLGVQMLYSKIVSKKQVLKLFFFVMLIYPLLSIQNLSYIRLVFKREMSKDYTVGLEELDTKSSRRSIFTDIHFKDLSSLLKTHNYHAIKPIVTKPIFNKKEYYQNISKYRAELKNDRTNLSGEVWMLKEGNKQYYKNGYALDPEYVAQGLTEWYNDKDAKAMLGKASMPGKLYTHLQTMYFIRTNSECFFLGAGMGCYSSKLAIKMTGLELQGSYPDRKTYIAIPFLEYHFYTLLHYLSKHVAEHSVMNMPNSVYNQILGEYGVVGILLFIMLYVGFFFAKRKKIKHLIPLLLLLLLLFEVEYWFEVLSLTIIFELMVFSEIYAKKEHE